MDQRILPTIGITYLRGRKYDSDMYQILESSFKSKVILFTIYKLMNILFLQPFPRTVVLLLGLESQSSLDN